MANTFCVLKLLALFVLVVLGAWKLGEGRLDGYGCYNTNFDNFANIRGIELISGLLGYF
jgi:hypothetical protein